MYDYLIVGGGPTGLTLAWVLAQYGYKSLIIEREREIGGNHRVRRVNNLFVEHGPRLYFGGSFGLHQVLKEMGSSFDEIFTPYRYSFNEEAIPLIAGSSNIRELFWLARMQFGIFWNKDYGKDQTVLEYLREHNFSDKMIDIADSYCRLTDGAGADRYTVFEFAQLVNQHMFYKNYEPRLPNDRGLFHVWTKALRDTGLVEIWLESELINLNEQRRDITSATVMKEGYLVQIQAKNYILAVPPQNLVKILSNSASIKVKNAFGSLSDVKKWEKESRYINYVPIVYHWDVKLDLNKPWTYPVGPWKIGFMVMSDYIHFTETESRTVITTVISDLDTVIPSLGKTANQASEEELKMTVLKVLEEYYGKLPSPVAMIMSPGVFRTGRHQRERWDTIDTSFILTKAGFIDQSSKIIPNLFNAGTHNGHAKYHFTSIESAISNAFALIHKLIPEKNIKKMYPIKEPLTLSRITWYIIKILVILTIILLIRRYFGKYLRNCFSS